jgi:hypothetical protein
VNDADLDEVVTAALRVDGIESAAVFAVAPGSHSLELAAAAGITGPALDGLVAAVRNPTHPVARALSDEGPSFDVLPMAPGGPRLRSHLPLQVERDGRREAVGVLALAHDPPLTEAQRSELNGLAARAAAAIRP